MDFVHWVSFTDGPMVLHCLADLALFTVALVALVFLIKGCSLSAVWHTFTEEAVVWFYLCLKGAICKMLFQRILVLLNLIKKKQCVNDIHTTNVTSDALHVVLLSPCFQICLPPSPLATSSVNLWMQDKPS